MLDKECFKILKKLSKLNESSSYKVIEWNDLCKTTSIKLEALRNDITHLKNNGYIDVKYVDENELCVSILPRGRELKEEREMVLYSHKSIMKVMLWSGIFSGLMAFIGAFLAILIGR